jgi:hypothetical protein
MSYPYTPPPSPYPPPPVQYRPPPQRSAIPRVVGILAIVFCVLGLLMSLGATLGPKDDLELWEVTTDQLGFFGTWLDIYLVLSVGVFALHLAGGIAAVAYKRSGPPLITIYAIVAILLSVVDVVVALTSVPESIGWVRGDLIAPRIGIAVLALPWPIVAVVLMNLRGAKRACGHDVPES